MSGNKSQEQKNEEFNSAVGQLIVLALVFYLFAVALMLLMKALIFTVTTLVSILGGALGVALIVGTGKKVGIMVSNLSMRKRRQDYLQLLKGGD